MVPFSDILFKQQAYWVSELQVDTLVPSVFLQLVCDPEIGEKECDVVFKSVSEINMNYYGELDETKEEYLCTLIDVSDNIKDGKHYYLILTDTVELSFCTSETPTIYWQEPDKPYQSWKSEKIVWNKNT